MKNTDLLLDFMRWALRKDIKLDAYNYEIAIDNYMKQHELKARTLPQILNDEREAEKLRKEKLTKQK